MQDGGTDEHNSSHRSNVTHMDSKQNKTKQNKTKQNKKKTTEQSPVHLTAARTWPAGHDNHYAQF